MRWHQPVGPQVLYDFSFLGATLAHARSAGVADVLIFAILAGLSVYMATGGAQQLLVYLDYLAGR